MCSCYSGWYDEPSDPGLQPVPSTPRRLHTQHRPQPPVRPPA